jgi:hypothetical protein
MQCQPGASGKHLKQVKERFGGLSDMEFVLGLRAIALQLGLESAVHTADVGEKAFEGTSLKLHWKGLREKTGRPIRYV